MSGTAASAVGIRGAPAGSARSQANVAAAAASDAASTATGAIAAPTRSRKYEMMMGEARNESADAATASAPVSTRNDDDGVNSYVGQSLSIDGHVDQPGVRG